tara:strand:+ start:627 stop:1553 length:927 start_codon:yes stop_codon:yes gene_type:complete
LRNIFINSANEDWIADRFKSEWEKYNSEGYNFTNLKNADYIWILSPWMWKKIPKRYLKKKKVICTIHHIDEEKFDANEEKDFMFRDQYVDKYHITTKKTLYKLKQLTKKEIIQIPFWVNQNLWFEIEDKLQLRKKYGLDKEGYYIGSFQRDTEGNDLSSPKLSKGPDRFIEIINHLNEKKENLHIILSGKRRQFVINNLEKLGINYTYFEMSSFTELNELYNILDLYIVASRVEGGPQSIPECALTRTQIISTDVGVASNILSPESIFKMDNFIKAKPNTEIAYQNVQKYLIPHGFKEFNENLFDDEN